MLDNQARFYGFTAPQEMSACLPLLGRFPKRIAFIGSGPMPLTSLLYLDFARRHNHPEMTVLNIEIDAARIAAAKKLLSRLDRGSDSGMEFLLADARNPVSQLAECDVVTVASFVGTSEQDKIDAISNLASQMVCIGKRPHFASRLTSGCSESAL